MSIVPAFDGVARLLTVPGWAAPFAGAAVKGSVVLLLAMVAVRLLRTHSASVRHAVWGAALLAQLVLPALAYILPQWTVLPLPTPGEPATTESGATSPTVAQRAASTRAIPVGEPATTSAILSVGGDPQPQGVGRSPRDERTADGRAPTGEGSGWSNATPAAGPAAMEAAPSGGVDWSPVLWTIWCVGAGLVLLRLALASAAVRRLAHRAQRVTDGRWLSLSYRIADDLRIGRPLALLRGESLSVPVTWGVVAPRVLLPAEADEWPAERWRIVLLHELAHVKRLDALTQWLSQVVLALCWYNPLVWIAVRGMRAESERACDDCVLRAGTEPSTYVHDLIAMVRSMRPARVTAAAALAMARPSEFEGRMLAILDARANRRALGRAAGALTAVATLCLVVPLAAMAPADGRTAPGAAPLFGAIDADGVDDATAPRRSDPAAPRDAYARPEAGTNKERTFDRRAAVGASVAVEPSVQAAATVYPRVAPQQGSGETAESRAAERQAAREAARAERRSERDAAADSRAHNLAVPPLMTALADRDTEVRRSAAMALGSLGDPRSVEALMQALRKDTDAGVREMAAWALGELEDRRAVPALSAALREDREPGVRNKAAWALGQIEDAGAVDALGAALRDDNADVRRTALWALGQIEDARAVPFLVPALKSEDPEMRRQAAWALGQIESGDAVAPLTAAIQDRDAKTREQIVWALGQIEDPRAAPALAAALRDSMVGVRRKAVWALGQLDGLPSAPPALVEALKDSDREVRKSAAHALGELEDPAAVPGLVAMSRDADPELRRVAAHALAEIRGPAALEALIALLKDEDPQVRRTAVQALGNDH
jgi:HEAT repeat protein/beta-lactamase regulating signal transducer with metallopeptidase domain